VFRFRGGLFIGATPLRLRRGFMAQCASLVDLWDVYPMIDDDTWYTVNVLPGDVNSPGMSV